MLKPKNNNYHAARLFFLRLVAFSVMAVTPVTIYTWLTNSVHRENKELLQQVSALSQRADKAYSDLYACNDSLVTANQQAKVATQGCPKTRRYEVAGLANGKTAVLFCHQ